ncbi:MAG: HesA/MoeB/ThiF family protein [Methanomicrobiales archaeon]|nr:HesA/MoeB/ThiF family protein [Methanomicrobiales archaeon]
MLTEREIERYSRQIAFIGEEGQERLKAAHVVLAGAGGLGCPAALYLAVAGLGRLTIIDSDQVEMTNLNRQILHWEQDIGRNKTVSARDKLQAVNPDMVIDDVCEVVTGQNAKALTRQATLIIDALDNFPARYALNLAALVHGIPCIHGAVSGYDGHLTTVIPGETACLQCIFPNPPGGSEFPIIGTTAGIIGLMQAHEAIKFLTGRGTLMKNRLLIWDGRDSSVTFLDLEPDPECTACGNGTQDTGRGGGES